MPRITKKIPGLSMLEILVVIAIIGIFMALALPNLMGVVSDARATEAKQMLKHVHTLQKNYFFQKAKYGSSINEIDFEQEKLVSEGGNAYYRIEIYSATQNTYEAHAEAVSDFDGDGQLNKWSINQDQVIKELVED